MGEPADELADFVIAGAGAAGLSLALALMDSELAGRRVLLIDRDVKDDDDRTFSFWTERPEAFERYPSSHFPRLEVAWNGGRTIAEPVRHRYLTIRSLPFYRTSFDALLAHDNVRFVCDSIVSIEERDGWVEVVGRRGRYRGRFAFDSRFELRALRVDEPRYQRSEQRFFGWLIETPDDRFDPSTMTFFDFRGASPGSVCFFYVLPYSRRLALVEHVAIDRAADQESLGAYVREVLGITQFKLRDRELGASPLTDQPWPRRGGKRILRIGIPGGQLKASTGYGFLRMQADARAIVRSLAAHGHPFDLPRGSRLFARLYEWLDAILLVVMRHEPAQIERIFAALFAKSPVDRVLAFLEERASLADILGLVITLPPWPFARAMLRWTWRRLRAWLADRRAERAGLE
ncbi:MAG: hypothetical protein IT378_17615 [Sandaracinaceae bacterium]|nr:hypothetical protein [Sandaracinaceae bacterium]